MHNRSVLRALALAALVVAAGAAIGIGAYNAGMAQGIAQTAPVVAAPPPGVPGAPGAQYVYVWPRPWGYGYHFFPFFPFFGLLLFFFVLRGLLWRAHWRRGYGNHRHDGVPPWFDEWHRRMHEQQPPAPPTTPTTT